MNFEETYFLVHLPIQGCLLDHKVVAKAEEVDIIVELLGSDPKDALKEVEKSRGYGLSNILKQEFKRHMIVMSDANQEENCLRSVLRSFDYYLGCILCMKLSCILLYMLHYTFFWLFFG